MRRLFVFMYNIDIFLFYDIILHSDDGFDLSVPIRFAAIPVS